MKAGEERRADRDNMDSRKVSLKSRITSLFRPSSLLRNSCTTTTTRYSRATTRDIHNGLSPDPPIVLGPQHHCNHLGDELLFTRSSLERDASSPSPTAHHQRHAASIPADCQDCRAICTFHASVPSFRCFRAWWEEEEEEEEGKKIQAGVFCEAGEGDSSKCTRALPSFSSKNRHDSCPYDRLPEQEKETRAERKDKTKKKKTKLLPINGFGLTSSSSPENGGGLRSFSWERDEDIEAFSSSRSIFSDTFEIYHSLSGTTTKNKKNVKRDSSHLSPRRGDGSGHTVSMSSGEMKEKARKLVEVEGGFAVEKWSSNPYEDFLSSMVEMILERRMVEAIDLERLLQSYLSLNSPQNHGVILKAFSDAWKTILDN